MSITPEPTPVAERKHRRRSLFWPVFLIIVGGVLFLNTLGVLPGDAWSVVWRLWPLFLVIGGLDNLYRGEGLVGPILFIGAGMLFLLGNFGYLGMNPWDVILRFWPVLIIAFGLDLIFGHQRNRWWMSLLGVLLGLALIAGIIYMAMFAPIGKGSIHTESISQPLNEATRVEVTLESIFGEMRVGGGAAESNFVEGVLNLASTESYRESYTVSGGAGVYRLESEGSFTPYPFFGSTSAIGWELRFNQSAAMEFHAKTVMGSQVLDLAALKVTNLESETVMGRSQVTLPAEGDLSGEVQVVMGEMVLYVPKDASVTLHLDTAVVGIALPAGYVRNQDLVTSPAGTSGQVIDLTLKIPVGNLRVEYAR